jgi:hypothetical protein
MNGSEVETMLNEIVEIVKPSPMNPPRQRCTAKDGKIS